MENRLRNLSILVEEYQIHILDLIRFSWIKSSKENSEAVLSRIFVSVFKALRNKHATEFPIHIFVYHRAVKTILKTKSLTKKHEPSVKELDNDINIEDFDPNDYKNTRIIEKFNSITPLERLILCINVRHKLSIDETATIFSITPGAVLSKLNKSRTDIAKEIIRTSSNTVRKVLAKKPETKDCFFAKNLQSSHLADALKEKDKKQLEDHLSKCKNCKTYYEWNLLIDALINQVEKPILDNQVNRHIFYQIERFALLRNILYKLKNSWKLKVPFVTLISIVFIILTLNGFKYFSHMIKIKKQIVPVKQEIPVVVKKKINYLMSIKSNDVKTINNTILDLAKKLNANTVDNSAELMTIEGEIYHFGMIINKNEVPAFIDTIKKITDFEITENEELIQSEDEKTKIEVLVRKNNVK